MLSTGCAEHGALSGGVLSTGGSENGVLRTYTTSASCRPTFSFLSAVLMATIKFPTRAPKGRGPRLTPLQNTAHEASQSKMFVQRVRVSEC